MLRPLLPSAATAPTLALTVMACNLASALTPRTGAPPIARYTHTHHLTGTSTAPAAWPCTIEATRTHPAGAPTRSPGPGGTPET